jgi:hydroxypyruvate isomerase
VSGPFTLAACREMLFRARPVAERVRPPSGAAVWPPSGSGVRGADVPGRCEPCTGEID